MTGKKRTGASTSAPKILPAKITAARKAAFEILLAVERGQSHSDGLLRGRAVEKLSDADRNLTTALVLGVLRWQIWLDSRVRALLARPNARLDAEILIALRLGAFQILRMDRIPARAAIDESVELAKQAGHRFASGMVNAVLRKLAAAPAVDDSGESGAAFALALAHPAWMVERWIAFYGMDAAREICRHGQRQPVMTVRLTAAECEKRDGIEDRGIPPIPQAVAERMGQSANSEVEDQFAAAGIVSKAGELLSGSRIVVSGDVSATAAFREGRVRIQDEGSQLVAELAGCAPEQTASNILDACAAPGGKTLILAERYPQARIVACEASAPRLEQLKKRLAYLGERVECRLADATTLADEAVYDLVLADVPCSGTGTLGRNPEIRHRLRAEELPRQAERQRAILLAALRAVRPGGLVVYSTCSLEPEENEQVIAAVLAGTHTARLISLGRRIGELLADGVVTASGAERLRASLSPEGFLRLMPGPFQTDGFFVAMLERRA